MSQIFKTKNFGEIEFEKTWINSDEKGNVFHIGKLTKGGYAYINGLPITSQKILREAIPKGPELDEALEWFKNKDKAEEEGGPKKRTIIILPNGDYAFEGGEPITDAADLTVNLPAGPALNGALQWWTEKHKEVEAEKRKEATAFIPRKPGRPKRLEAA
jgi:hypothetical protein